MVSLLLLFLLSKYITFSKAMPFLKGLFTAKLSSSLHRALHKYIRMRLYLHVRKVSLISFDAVQRVHETIL